ncbi:ATP-binding protein [Sulfuriflexus mobilis]|uniref:ATP-binding protein n=1 Tax=Sulfuriflexus mobilis TaxID=1811807 RepID=UPI000F841A81|nr:ATP-binding protein [Sulfuriflexus mobilis]
MMLKSFIDKWMPASIRQDQEYKSAIVRLSIGVFMSIYLGMGTTFGYFEITTYNFSILLLSFMVYSIFVLIYIMRRPGYVPRRYLVTFIDIVYVTISSIMVGKSDSPFYLLYIIIFISQGGRFGRSYLFVAAGLSALSYSLVCVLDPNFSSHALESTFKLIALIVLPLYLDSMLKTIQRARQAADAASESKSRFLASMSHEIRTPMSGAIGMINLLKTTDLSDDQKVYVNGLTTSSNRLHMLINDILDFSKIEAGKITLEERCFSIEDTLQEVSVVLSPLAKQKHIGFNYEINPAVPKNLLGDSYRLSQILLNLAGNAIKFTERGGVTIKVSIITTSNSLRVEITDTGIGIDEQHLSHIFDSFTQADSSTTRRFGGTGLGTTIARELVRMMGGDIGVNSEFGKGSSFWFEIPLRLASNQATLRDEDEAVSVRSPTGAEKKRRVLLAEDSEVNALFISTALTDGGHHVEVVKNGKLALQRLRQQDYDIVFMDMHMPVMDGIEATRQWRAEEPSDKSVPIIALTANISDDDRLACLQAGMNEFLSKPVSPERLFNVLENFATQAAD